jgi:ABC-type Fe3+-hydroxamate transport system substrate-binding protein
VSSSGPPRDDLGYPVGLARPARRVVSLVPSLTETVAATRREALVGATQWCTHPSDLEVQRVRGTKNPDLGAVTGLRPDLVLANKEENRRLDVERLRAAGVPVWVTDIRTLDGAIASLRRMFSAALGWPEPPWLAQAERAWREPVPGLPLRAAIAIWRDPWMVVGSRTFTGDLLARLGIENVFGEHADRYPTVTVSDIVQARPELVLLPDEPYPFSATDGPEAFAAGPGNTAGGLPTVLVSGRLLTWYGPSLLTARAELTAALATALDR